MSNEVNEIFVSTGLVYVAGVEFPVNNITVSYGIGQIPQATFNVPGDSELERLGAEDKVPVAIFYLDQWYSEEGREDKIEPKYCLLFDGEITGWGFRKSVDGRSIVFTATHVIGTMTSMFAKFLLGDATAHTASEFMSQNTVQNVVVPNHKHFPFNLYQKGIFDGPAAKVIDRPFDFVENLLLPMRIGGYPSFPSIQDRTPAVNGEGSITTELKDKFIEAESLERITTGFYNDFTIATTRRSAPMDFFVKHNHKVKFDQRWIASTLERYLEVDTFNEINNIEDETTRKIMESIHQDAQRGVLENKVGQGGSFYDILQVLYSVMVYEILMLPVAQYVAVGGRSNKLDRGVPLESRDTSVSSEFRLGNYISKPIAHFSLPPACNIIFPAMAPGFGYEENYSTQVTRTVVGSPFLDYVTMKTNQAGADLQRKLATTNGWPLALKDIIEKETAGNVNNVLLYPEEYFKGPVINHITMPPWYRYVSESVSKSDISRSDASKKNDVKAAAGESPDLVDPKVSKEVPEETNRYSTDAAANRNTMPNAKPSIRDTNTMFTRYSRLKYYENRFGGRNGSIDGMPFNPYLIPGYGFTYIGEHSGSFAFTGLVGNVNHNISADGGMTTSMSYGYGRTLKENYEIAIQDALGELELNGSVPKFHSTAPTMPMKKLADTLQHTETARDYYRNLFYQDSNSKKETVFDFLQFFESKDSIDGNPIPTSTPIPKDTSSGFSVTLENTPERDAERGNYSKAMQYASRPVCTLDEYIDFINGGVGVGFSKLDLLPAEKYGVQVPTFIRKYLADEESVEEKDSKTNNYISPTLTPTSEVFDLRRNWVAKIQRYREKVHNKEIQS